MADFTSKGNTCSQLMGLNVYIKSSQYEPTEDAAGMDE